MKLSRQKKAEAWEDLRAKGKRQQGSPKTLTVGKRGRGWRCDDGDLDRKRLVPYAEKQGTW